MVAIIVAIIQLSEIRHWIKRVILDRLKISPQSGRRKPRKPEQPFSESELAVMTAKESKIELVRIQKLIEIQKKIAWDKDIAHHLWDLYKTHLASTSPHSLDRYFQDGEWYDVKILQENTQNGQTKIEFELKGSKYKFVDNEEKQGWRETMKTFSLFLYDDSDHCLIEIPMKMKVDSEGRNYSISSGGPNAFLPGGWTNDFIDVKLKHQSIRNEKIREQKHQERLREIEDLKDRFGSLD